MWDSQTLDISNLHLGAHTWQLSKLWTNHWIEQQLEVLAAETPADLMETDVRLCRHKKQTI